MEQDLREAAKQMSCSCPYALLPVPISSEESVEHLDRQSSKDECPEGKHASRP